MTKLLWDQTGEKRYENGVDQGVLYIPTAGLYTAGYAWNGLVTVTESPSGAEASKQYADNIAYLNLQSAEEFGATIEAFTYPTAFEQCDGSVAPSVGLSVGQQTRKVFGLSYRTKVGNDSNPDAGYKIHLVYGALASPSEKAYTTLNESPEAITFSWELTTTPVAVTGLKPTAIITVDSTKVTGANLTALENIIYGSVGADARLPLPDEVIGLFAGGLTLVNLGILANQPTFVAGTGVVTLPTVTGIQWKMDGVNKTPGAQTAIASGVTTVIDAVPTTGYALSPGSDDDWSFTRP